MAESLGTQEIPPFKIKINTWQPSFWPHPATDKVYIQFPLKNGKMVEVESTKEGPSAIYIDETWISLIAQENDDFKFVKRGKKNVLQTWFGLTVSQDFDKVDIRAPGFYHDKTFGICGNNNKDAADDYTTKEGEILPPPPANMRKFSRHESEEKCATSWITGSRDRRGCLMYEEKPILITPELDENTDSGPGPEVDFR